MSIRFVIFISILLSCLQSSGQERKKDSLNLRIYSINSCLAELFTAIVKSNKKYYNDEYYYTVSFVLGAKVNYISITPEKWAYARFSDYTGALQIYNKLFLVRGDLNSDSLFKVTDLPKKKVSLQVNKDESSVIGLEPSMQGYYHNCKGKPIYVEIYTKGKLPKFKKKMIVQDLK